MANYEDIIQHYAQEGWLTIPSYYNTEGKEPRCKICGHENDHGYEDTCSGCYDDFLQDCKEKKAFAGIPVNSLSQMEWQIFQVIAREILNRESPYTTPEEFAEECKKNAERQQAFWRAKNAEKQKIDTILRG